VVSVPTAVELLWGMRPRPTRGPKPSLSLDRIIAEAIALTDAEGLASLSMQRLAERLGYTKMSLYRYVPGRAELTALMLDHGLGAPPAPERAENWRDALRRWALAMYQRYRAHPWSIELTTGARPFGPNEMAWLETALAALDGTPLTGPERLDTVVLLNGHVRNLVQQTAPGQDPETLEDELAEQMGAVLAGRAAEFPHAAAAYADPGPGRDNALCFGIDRILDGIAALIAERA
jgi:AcrR family transcriptional regulator